jgi:hypothetical protein
MDPAERAPNWVPLPVPSCSMLYRVTVPRDVGRYRLPGGLRDRLAFVPWLAESARSSSAPVHAVPSTRRTPMTSSIRRNEAVV